MHRLWLLLSGSLLLGILGWSALGAPRPGRVVLLQDTAYPPPAVTETFAYPAPSEAANRTPSPTGATARGTPTRATQTLQSSGTPTVTVTPSQPAPTGPNRFLTEDAEMFQSFATVAATQSLPPTRTATVTQTPTITRTPTATRPSSTPTSTRTRAGTLTITATSTATPTPRPAGAIDWRLFGLGFTLPLLVVAGAVGLLVLRSRAGK